MGLALHQAKLLGELAGEHLFDEADLLLAANVVLFHCGFLSLTAVMCGDSSTEVTLNSIFDNENTIYLFLSSK